MTRQRHLHRSAVLAVASAVFAVTATGSALAWNGTIETLPVAPAGPTAATVAPSLSAAPTAVQRPVAATAKAVASKPAPKATTHRATTRAASSAGHRTSAPVTKPATTRPVAAAHSASARAITISHYVDSPGSQKAIDKCNLVLWTRAPLWLAAHNFCGFQWLAYVPTGTTVRVTSGAAVGTYVVTGHLRLSRQSGALPRLHADLVLQTCVGSSTGLTLLRRA